MTPMFNLAGNERQLRRIKTTQISRNPNQPRKYFEPEAISQLADSIRQYGVLNPLTVRRTGDGYELDRASGGCGRRGPPACPKCPASS